MEGINKYPVFKANQVLNHNHLNTLREYLDIQDRITRNLLIGTGIICGFEIKLISQNTIRISDGCGITSMGFLLHLIDPETGLRDYTHYREFNTPQNYQTFENVSKLYELRESNENAQSLNDGELDLEKMAVVLFLDYADNEIDTCVVEDCDERGTWREFTLRPLLIQLSELLELIKIYDKRIKNPEDINTESDLEEELNKKYRLPYLVMHRPFKGSIGPKKKSGSNYQVSYADIERLYISAIRYTFYGKSTIRKNQLISAIEKAWYVYHLFFGNLVTWEEKNHAMNTLKEIIETLNMKDERLKDREPVDYIQYYYDFFKELIDAYNEFTEVAFWLVASCSPDMKEFPRHLMLGEVVAEDNCKPSAFRHHLRQPPVYNENKSRLEKVARLFKRILLMIESFEIPSPEDKQKELEERKSLDDMVGIGKQPFKITPCKGYEASLSSRSIPFYYSVSDTKNSLQCFWNYEMYKKCRCNSILSYNAFSYNNQEAIVEPIEFNIDGYPFFRIEGHMGNDINMVYGWLNKTIRGSNLPFDVIPAYIGNGETTIAKLQCGYGDLQTHYSEWRNKTLYLLTRIVTLTKTYAKPQEAEKEVKDEMIREFSKEIHKSAVTADFSGFRKSFTEYSKNRIYETTDLLINSYSRVETSGDLYKTRKFYATAQPMTAAAYVEETENFFTRTLSNVHQDILSIISLLPVDLADFNFEEYQEVYRRLINFSVSMIKNYLEALNDSILGANILILYRFLGTLGLIHYALSAFGTYAYIRIRNIVDTYKYRNRMISSVIDFLEVTQKYPGLEHLAGVPKGGTFIIVYQHTGGEEEEEEKEKKKEKEESVESMESLFMEKKIRSSREDMHTVKDLASQLFKPEIGMDKLLSGNVVADFSLPYRCCQKCIDLDPAVFHLIPFAIHHMRFLIPNADQMYSEQNIQLMDNMYDPEIFVPEISVEPQFGTASLEDKIYEPSPSKKKKVLKYTVTSEDLENNLRTNMEVGIVIGTYFDILLEEFEYSIRDVTKDTIVDKEKISMFIFKLKEQPAVGIVSGTVTMADTGETVPGVNIMVEGTDKATTTNYQGTYTLNLQPGNYEVSAYLMGYYESKQPIDVVEGENILNFTLIPEYYNWGTVNVVVMDQNTNEPLPGVTVRIPGTGYTAVSDNQGKVKFTDVPVGSKILEVYKQGYQAKSNSYTIQKGTNSISFQIGQKAPLDVKYDELYNTMKVQPETYTAKRIAESYSQRADLNKAVMDRIKRDKHIKPGSAIYEAEEKVKSFTEEREINIVKLNNEYNNTRNELLSEMEKAIGKEKQLYAESLKALTFAYLDRLALEQPEKFSETTENTLIETAQLLKGVKEFDIKQEINQYAEASKNNLPSEFISNVKSKF